MPLVYTLFRQKYLIGVDFNGIFMLKNSISYFLGIFLRKP